MIVALSVILFCYLFVALLASTILTSVVAVKSKLDFRLMYLQHPFDKFRNLKLFKTNLLSKFAFLFCTFIALVLIFLPTLLTIQSDLIDYEIYYINERTIGQEEPQGGIVPDLIQNNEAYPIFDSLVRSDYRSPAYDTRDTNQVLRHYFYHNLKKQVEPNLSGVWYGGLSGFDESSFKRERVSTANGRHKYPELSQQEANTITGTYSPRNSNVTTYTFGLQNQDSSTLKLCTDISGATLIINLTDIEGHKIQAMRGAQPSTQVCYPLNDPTLPILVQPGNQKIQPSVLDSNERLFRPSHLSDTYNQIDVTLSVSGMNLNNTHLSMGIKKTVHITLYNNASDYKNADVSLNCSLAKLNEPHDPFLLSFEAKHAYNNVNHTRIVCALRALSQQNPDMPILQASRRVTEQNSSLNSVYTYLADTQANPLGGYMVDLTWFTAYTVAAPVAVFPEDNKEYLVAHIYMIIITILILRQLKPCSSLPILMDTHLSNKKLNLFWLTSYWCALLSCVETHTTLP
jgi:hypothetical protein